MKGALKPVFPVPGPGRRSILSPWHLHVQPGQCCRDWEQSAVGWKASVFDVRFSPHTPVSTSSHKAQVLSPAAYRILETGSLPPPKPYFMDTNINWGFDRQHWNPLFIKIKLGFTEWTALCQVLSVGKSIGRQKTTSSSHPKPLGFFSSVNCLVHWAQEPASCSRYHIHAWASLRSWVACVPDNFTIYLMTKKSSFALS